MTILGPGTDPLFVPVTPQVPGPETMQKLQRLVDLCKPAPSADVPRKRTVWVVQQISGGRLRVLADWHSSAPQPEGAELRFYNHDGDDRQRRVATVRAGSWHWCVAESELDPKGAES